MMFNININIGSGNRVISKEKPTINIIIEPAKRIDILLYHIVAHWFDTHVPYIQLASTCKDP